MDLVVHRFEAALPNISDDSLQATLSKVQENFPAVAFFVSGVLLGA